MGLEFEWGGNIDPPSSRGTKGLDTGTERVEWSLDLAVVDVLAGVPRERHVDQRRLCVAQRVAEHGVAIGHIGSPMRATTTMRVGPLTVISMRRLLGIKHAVLGHRGNVGLGIAERLANDTIMLTEQRCRHLRRGVAIG